MKFIKSVFGQGFDSLHLHQFRSVGQTVKSPPFHGGDQGFDTPTGYIMISGRSMVGQRFLVPLIGVRISTGKFA